ncbi:Glucan endo-1,3-beta-glucosidase 6 [Vitis vinifera]|uniref:glucan endo-1,3-beta-D-glucosidase n=1 Tax=Vitis vinifera TaxID=29760 RepID=A0A438DNB6_VITVI|nr:Glucan endo-1,3-beta-glucosidase 6 [Vitis vinifera]
MGWLSVAYGLVSVFSLVVHSVSGIGANWGTQATHPLPPETVVDLLRDNGIDKVKLFDADYGNLKALGKTRIEVMVGIPNEMLASLAGSVKSAEKWVAKNVSEHMTTNNVNISRKELYIIFILLSIGWILALFGGWRPMGIQFMDLQNSLLFRGSDAPLVGSLDWTKTLYNHSGCYWAFGSWMAALPVSISYLDNLPCPPEYSICPDKSWPWQPSEGHCPLNADVYASSTSLPSGGDFRTDIHDYMIPIVKFLMDNNAPFTVNIYPFISLYIDSNFPVEYAFFDGNASPLNDGGTYYYNMFDANYDTLVWALEKNGFGNLPIIVGEIGWPTDGDQNANLDYAQRFNQGFMTHISGGKGTPKRAGPVDAYLFSLIDEDGKSIQPGSFERHWGVFYFDGSPKYQFNLGTTNSGSLIPARNVKHLEQKWCVMKPSAGLDDPQVAPSVQYACEKADCTSLGYQTSCGGLDARGNISYAFNSYYQTNNQLDTACQFPNVSKIVKTDPSTGTCIFRIGIQQYYGSADRKKGGLQSPLILVGHLILFLLTVL